MDDKDALAAASALVDEHYISIGATELGRRAAATSLLLTTRCIPQCGWGDEEIEYLLRQLAMMDINNSSESVGAGEREGRVFSRLVASRCFRFSHGIGRSGDITAQQPKAAGSSLMYILANAMALHAIRLCGIQRTESALLVPVATGMAMVLVLSTLKRVLQQRLDSESLTDKHAKRESGAEHSKDGLSHCPSGVGATSATAEAGEMHPIPGVKYVIWSRIDQKSCFKSIFAAGCRPFVVPLKRLVESAGEAGAAASSKTPPQDCLTTDVDAIAAAIALLGKNNIVAVITTTSCFAPRGMDDVVAVAELCKASGIPHVINNAYGLQSSKMCHAINEAIRVGRVDAFVQSCDKNFMGVDGLAKLIQQRKRVYAHLMTKMEGIAAKYGERMLYCKRNDISMAMTLETLRGADASAITLLGSMLFTRQVSGARVIHPAKASDIEGFVFRSYGASFDDYPYAYMTAAAAIGMSEEDVDVFIQRLDKCLKDLHKKQAKKSVTATAKGEETLVDAEG